MNFERGKSTKDALNIGEFRDRPRKTGKTTRTVNEAIEFLFKSGNICIPGYSKIKDRNGVPAANILNAFIDSDALLGPNVQKILWEKIINRLRYEHDINLFDIDMKKRFIKLKN